MPKHLAPPCDVPESTLCECEHAKTHHSLFILQAACQHCTCPSFNPHCTTCGHVLDFHTWAASGDKRQWQCMCECGAFTLGAIQETLL
jgi:hypothetical protein